MIERLRKCLDDRNVAIGVFVDLQKAFDTVDHRILCHKAESLQYKRYRKKNGFLTI